MLDNAITFEPVNHTYTVEGLKTLGSVTSLVHCFSVPFEEDKIIQGMQNGKNWPRVGYLRQPPPATLITMLASYSGERAQNLLKSLKAGDQEDIILRQYNLFLAENPSMSYRLNSLIALDAGEIKKNGKTIGTRLPAKGHGCTCNSKCI